MYCKISCNVKIVVMHLYEHNLLSLSDILDCVGFSPSTFWCTLKLWQGTGDVVKHNHGLPGCPCILHFDNVSYLIHLVNHHPSWFLDELLDLLETNWFIATHYTTIHQELVQAGISLKKLRKIVKGWDEDQHAEFVRWMSQYDAEKIGSLMKPQRMSGLHSDGMVTQQRGVCVQKKGVFVHGCRLSAVGLLTLDGMVASNVIKGSFTAAKFKHFLEHDVVCHGVNCALFFMLLTLFYQLPLCSPYPGPLSILVMDNACIHHDEEVEELVWNAGK